MHVFLRKTFRLSSNIIIGSIFVSTAYLFIVLHDLAPVKDSLFNIKRSFYADNQIAFNHSLDVDEATFLKVRIKFESRKGNSIYSFSANGKSFRYKKMHRKKDDIIFYEFWIQEEDISKNNKFIVKLSRPLFGSYRINFKNRGKLNDFMYIIFKKPSFFADPLVLSYGMFILLVALYYLFALPGEDIKKRIFRVFKFILLLSFCVTIEWLFNFNLKSDKYFFIFLFAAFFSGVRKKSLIVAVFSKFSGNALIKCSDFKNKVIFALFSSKLKAFSRKLLFTSITFIFIFFIFEILSYSIIRLYYVRNNIHVRAYEYFIKTGKGYSRHNIASWTSHPYIPYIPEININEEDGQLFNSYGYRSRSVHGDDGIRVVCLGESTTFGWCVKTEETWCYLLERYLREYFGRDDVYVINFGIPSSSSELSLALLHFKALALKPDLVLVLQGISESQYWAEDGKRKADFSDFALRADWPERKLLNPFLVFASRSSLFRLFLYIKASSSPQIIPYFYGRHEGLKRVPEGKNESSYELVPWQDIYERNLKSIIGICEINNIDVCLLENTERPGPTNLCDSINDVSEKVARETDADYIPLTNLSDVYYVDAFHVNAEGQIYKAKEITNFLIENKPEIFTR